MSRWLKSVNTLLEQLDGQVETAVEEHEEARNADRVLAEQDAAVESILAKRGYVQQSEDIEDEVQDVATGTSETAIVDTDDNAVAEGDSVVDGNVKKAPLSSVESAESPPEASPSEHKESVEFPQGLMEKSADNSNDSTPKSHPDSPSAAPEEEDMDEVLLESEDQPANRAENSKDASDVVNAQPKPSPEGSQTGIQSEPVTAESKLPSAKVPVIEKVANTPPTTFSRPTTPSFEAEYKKALFEAREAQKECRTLRRHVVSLNSELESAEAEIQAQRTELERAAERMEKDRTRQKEEKDGLLSRHAQELKALKLQHEQTLAQVKARAEQQVEEARQRIKEIEQRRMQEGGDWTKEMENALHREQESVRRMANLEDEKATLLSQISTLQAQQLALENRLESVSQTADNAMEREREAEDRLDAALSMHARQLTQRQAREAELERTIADLGAALVVARNKEINRLKSDSSDATAGERGGNDVSALRTRLEDTEDLLETVKAQLDLERQRSRTLQEELQEVSKERTEEASAAHARQLQSDRKIADMSVTISRLQATIRDTKKASFGDSKESVYSSNDGERSSQIKSLSDQLLKQQETIARSKSEISALKNRLQVAVNRADKAEEALLLVQDSDDIFDRMESAPLSGSSDVGRPSMRRRGRGSSSGAGSIRSAIRLNSGQSQNGEKIGKAIDAVDSFSVQTGKYLRANPLARAGFLLYLLMIHLWTFVVLIFHTHGFETVHGDFGAGHDVPHGPHALMQAHHDTPVPNP